MTEEELISNINGLKAILEDKYLSDAYRQTLNDELFNYEYLLYEMKKPF